MESRVIVLICLAALVTFNEDATVLGQTTESEPDTTEPPYFNPCNPPYQCIQGDKIADPNNCTRYQQCVGPYQWVISDVNCGGDKGPFDPLLDLCRPTAICDPTPCTIQNDTSRPQPEECIRPSTLDCSILTIEDYTVPDKYYCTSYFLCDTTTGQWANKICPNNEPFFDIDKSEQFEAVPCSNNIARCDDIPYEDCLLITGEPVEPTTEKATTEDFDATTAAQP